MWEETDVPGWEALACAFDANNRVLVRTEYEGKSELHRCFPLGDKYIVLDDYLKTGNHNRYVSPEYIVDVAVQNPA